MIWNLKRKLSGMVQRLGGTARESKPVALCTRKELIEELGARCDCVIVVACQNEDATFHAQGNRFELAAHAGFIKDRIDEAAYGNEDKHL